ncbi:MAG: hypothetical protein JNG89_18585 [Planctomycetaceae bacterium]|nr:hypothetical protein [Planctomycetaceae bacterium]
MPSRPNDIEMELATALRERAELYRHAHAALESLQQRLHAGDTMHRLSPELQRVLTAVRAEDERLAPLTDAWRRLSKSPGPELAAQIDLHQQQLERTLALVDRLTATAAADRSLLEPRLDEGARGRRMQAAYAAAVVGSG